MARAARTGTAQTPVKKPTHTATSNTSTTPKPSPPKNRRTTVEEVAAKPLPESSPVAKELKTAEAHQPPTISTTGRLTEVCHRDRDAGPGDNGALPHVKQLHPALHDLIDPDMPHDDPDNLVGYTLPRIYTKPLVDGPPGPCGCGCTLTPDTSLGFLAVAFAQNVLGVDLIPWQRWWLIHALELTAPVRPGRMPRFRFRRILTLISRQNGKTYLLKVLALFFMYMTPARLVLGAAQSLNIAKESWTAASSTIEGNEELSAEVKAIRRANGEQCIELHDGSRYMIAAATGRAGRGLSTDLLILDELREHRDWEAWAALKNTTIAQPQHMIVGITNAGDNSSVVLNSLRASAIAGSDKSMAVFEWSAPEDCPMEDRQGWAMANPSLGYRLTPDALVSAIATEPATVVRTENLCQKVESLHGGIDMTAWRQGVDRSASLGNYRDNIALSIDVAPDAGHISLVGATMINDDRVLVEVIETWNDSRTARRQLVDIMKRIDPYTVAWFPSMSAGVLDVEMKNLKLPRVKSENVVSLTGVSVSQACMSLADLVVTGQIVHNGDELLTQHAAVSQKLFSGETWRFRSTTGNVDALYAAAGAVYAARTVKPPRKREGTREWII